MKRLIKITYLFTILIILCSCSAKRPEVKEIPPGEKTAVNFPPEEKGLKISEVKRSKAEEYIKKALKAPGMEEGEELFIKALKASDNSLYVYDEYSMYLYNKHNYEKGLKVCNEAVAKMDKKTRKDAARSIIVRRGALYMNLGRYGEAIEDFDYVIKEFPDFSFAYFDRGRCHYYQGDLDKAEKDLKHCLELKTSNPTYFKDAEMYLTRIKTARSKLALENLEAKTEIKAREMGKNWGKKTWPYSEQEEKNMPVNLKAKLLAARAENAEESGNVREAYAYYEEALKLGDDDQFLYEEMGRFLLRQKEYEKAVELNNRALSKFKNTDTVSTNSLLLNRGRAYMELKEYNKALSDFNTLIAELGEPCEAYFERGKARYLLGRYREAKEDLKRAIELSPGNPPFYPEANKYLEDINSRLK